jgi:hypothetical protein
MVKKSQKKPLKTSNNNTFRPTRYQTQKRVQSDTQPDTLPDTFIKLKPFERAQCAALTLIC